MKNIAKALGFLTIALSPQLCFAVASAELYKPTAYAYGRFEARVRYAAGDGVVSSFFLWKDGSDKAGTFWNELDFEKVGANCTVQTNPIYGNPSANHVQKHTIPGDLCGAFHTYTYEWTPDYVAWLVDGKEIRRDTGATPTAFSQNASAGMEIHFNLWPGDATFGGNFNPAILPVHQYIDWVEYSTYQGGVFTLSWREDFTAATLPVGWLTGTWGSPKNLSTHAAENVNFINGYAVISLTADNAKGPAGAMPGGTGGASGTAGSGSGGAVGASGSPGTGGSNTGTAGAVGASGSPGSGGSFGTGGSPGTSGAPGAGGSSVVPGGGSPGASGSTSSASGSGPSNIAGGAGSSSAPPTDLDHSCSFDPSPSRGGLWWTMGVAAIAFLHRRGRRSR